MGCPDIIPFPKHIYRHESQSQEWRSIHLTFTGIPDYTINEAVIQGHQLRICKYAYASHIWKYLHSNETTKSVRPCRSFVAHTI